MSISTRGIVHMLAGHARIFDALRWLLEWGYHGQHALLRQACHEGTGPVLDIGCGTGVFARHFGSARYTGIDINPAYIAAARRKHPGYTFLCDDATQLMQPARHFEVCLISGVLHHLDDGHAGQVIEEAVRVLTDSGMLVLWEDIATRHSWNVVGRVAHAFDEGDHIRTASAYRALLAGRCRLDLECEFSSGFMDYCAFVCHRNQ